MYVPDMSLLKECMKYVSPFFSSSSRHSMMRVMASDGVVGGEDTLSSVVVVIRFVGAARNGYSNAPSERIEIIKNIKLFIISQLKMLVI